jgi:hypothetical protein
MPAGMIRAPNPRSARSGPGRHSFYRFQELYEKGGDLALAEMTRAKPNLNTRVAPQVEAAVVALWRLTWAVDLGG